jgi:glycosyltransferase involved in cell wall biosynthesis
MKKICHIIFEHHPLDGRVFYKEAVSLASAGYEVFILAPSLDGKTLGRKKEVDLQGKSFLEKSSVKLVPYHYNKNLPKQLGIRDYFTIKAIVQKALEIDADAYHFHEDKVSLEVFRELSCRFPDRKLVYDFHEFFPVQSRENRGKRAKLLKYLDFEFEIVSKSSLIFTVSDFLSDYYRHLGASNVSTLMNCQSQNIFRAEADKLKKKDYFYICHEGNLRFDRGLELILETSRLIDNPEIKFLILGKLPEKEMRFFHEFDAKHSIKDKFVFTGWQPYERVFHYLSQTKVGLCFMLSVNGNFGISNKFFNYLRTGVPILATPNPNTDAIIENFNCGVVFSRANASEIASAIMNLKNDQGYYQVLSVNSQRAFEEEYNWEKRAEILRKAYDALFR